MKLPTITKLGVVCAKVRIDFPEKVSYRNVKFVYEAWNTLGGYTMLPTGSYVMKIGELTAKIVKN